MDCHIGEKEGCYQMEIETEYAGTVGESTRCHYSLWQNGARVRDLGWGRRFIREDGQHCFALQVMLENLEEWNLDQPTCYRLRVELYDAGAALIDSREITVGLRRMEFTTDRGFFLNGRYVKVHGVCEHHDLGCLGAAFHKEAMRRKFRILKEMGVNALRTSHNMPAQEVMELADEMGILVLSEAFDMWERCKTPMTMVGFSRSGRSVTCTPGSAGIAITPACFCGPSAMKSTTPMRMPMARRSPAGWWTTCVLTIPKATR